MAEGGAFSSSTDDDLLFCSVCMEEYEDPRALPCLHTFCYNCLVQLRKCYVPSSNIHTRELLKCPLCAEEHPIPKDKGVAGFRKDFRINSLIGQQDMRSTDAIERNFSQGAMGLGATSETCLMHPNEMLLYHCESSSCQVDICEMCWSSSHDTHIVKLVSKKVKDAKELLEEQVDSSIVQINSLIDILIKTKENMVEHDAIIELNIQQRFIDMQEKLNKAFQQSYQELDSHKILQDEKVSDELGNQCALKDTFIQLRNDLEKENMPYTSKTFNKYANMYETMQQLTEDFTQWSFTYTTAQLPPFNFGEVIQKAITLKYLDATLDSKTVDPKKDPRGEKEDMTTKEIKTEKVYSLPKENKGKAAISKVWALQKGVDMFLGLQKGLRVFQGVHKEMIKGMQKGLKELHIGGEKSLAKPQRKSQKTLEVSELKWEAFIAKNKTNVGSIAVSRNGHLFVAANNQVSYYKTTLPAKVFEIEINENVDAITVASSTLDNIEFLTKLDAKRKMITFLSSKGQPNQYDYASKSLPVHKRTSKILASSGHFVCYPYNEGKGVFIAVLMVENDSPVVSSLGNVEVPFKSGRVRSVCMCISVEGTPVLICANTFHPGKTEKSQVAIVSMMGDEIHWELTFSDLDPDAPNFDLKGLACDNDNVFVLNNKSNAVYNVSMSGKCIRTLNMFGTPPKFHFTAPNHICLDRHSKSLYIAHHKNVISKFTYA